MYSLTFRGRIQLKSSNISDHPLIYPNYFGHPEDYKPFVEAFKFNKALAAALRKYGAKMFDKKEPGCTQYDEGK